jgi:hypothetical protein
MRTTYGIGDRTGKQAMRTGPHEEPKDFETRRLAESSESSESMWRRHSIAGRDRSRVTDDGEHLSFYH